MGLDTRGRGERGLGLWSGVHPRPRTLALGGGRGLQFPLQTIRIRLLCTGLHRARYFSIWDLHIRLDDHLLDVLTTLCDKVEVVLLDVLTGVIFPEVPEQLPLVVLDILLAQPALDLLLLHAVLFRVLLSVPV